MSNEKQTSEQPQGHAPLAGVSGSAVYIEYIADYRVFRLKKMGMNVFVYRNIGIQVDREQLTDHEISALLGEHNIEYDKVVDLLTNEEWRGTLEELREHCH